jgi:predicted GNAT family N-acyltransferase
VTEYAKAAGGVSADSYDPFEDTHAGQFGGVVVHRHVATAEAEFEEYERLLAPARDRFGASPGVIAIQASEDRSFLEAFLLYFSVLGSTMTEPVEGWLLSASERCAVLGLPDLSKALRGHARAEAGHHLMMIADARSLAARRLASNLTPIDVETLLKQAPSGGSLRYIKVHEATIQSAAPYAQVAIEYEIEMLPLRYGDRFIRHCIAVLGKDILSCLSFVTEHIVLDAAHTQFNVGLVKRLLHGLPHSMPALVSAGTEILGAYAEFLEDCVKLARRDVAARVASGHGFVGPLLWEAHKPPAETGPGQSIPNWLAEVRRLRASVLFENGRRPEFRTVDGRLDDSDPIDLHAHHILVYDGASLVGCVRVYRLTPIGPECVAEQVLGCRLFDAILGEQQVERTNTSEIGRWIVKPEHRGNGRIAMQLAAAAAVLAAGLERSDAERRHMVVCAVGTADGQDLILTRIGMTTATRAQPTRIDHLDDDVRVMYTVGGEGLKPHFRQLMGEMATTTQLQG